jgi:hypothetical protein
MATRKVYLDFTESEPLAEMQFFVNSKNHLYVEIKYEDDSPADVRCIVIDDLDINEIISDLKAIKKSIDEWVD